jgi:hypothetical protein
MQNGASWRRLAPHYFQLAVTRVRDVSARILTEGARRGSRFRIFRPGGA